MASLRPEGTYAIGAFQVGNTRAVRHANVRGDVVSVALMSDGTVEMVGKEGGFVRIHMIDVERVRVGFTEAKRRIYSTRIWHVDGRGPIELVPYPADWKAYRAFVERWAVLLVADRRMDRIELGTSKFDAALVPALFFPLMVVTLVLAIFILDGEPWYGRMIVPLVPVVLFSVFLRQTMKRLWPRPLRSLADLDAQLPP